MQPLYTAGNCKSAYELRWSLSIFATVRLPPADQWLNELKAVVERDDVRILEYHFREPGTLQFLLSTKPYVAPPAIVKSVKGRLQHMLQPTLANAFRRNFSLTSVGDSSRKTIVASVADQLCHHRMSDKGVQNRLAKFQLVFSDVDLSQPHFSSQERYLYNLHLVLVHDGRWAEIDEANLALTRDIFVNAAAKKDHCLSRLAILADHLHATLGCRYAESPEEVALGYLNNLAYAHSMKAIYRFSYFVGTFGEYDLGAVRRSL